MIKLEDLQQQDDLYYVGNIVGTDGHLLDFDGREWIEREEAELVLLEINNSPRHTQPYYQHTS